MIDEKSARLLLAIGEGAKRFTALQRVVRNPRTLSSRLKRLVELGLVEKDDANYVLSPEGSLALPHILELERILRPRPRISVERVPHEAFRPYLRRLVEKLLEWFGDALTGVLVFGSVARGDWTKDSDIDLLVVLERFETSRRETLRAVTALRAELRRSPEFRDCVSEGFFPVVQVYPLEREDAKRFRRMYLDALTEGIVLFERDSFLSELIEAFLERLRELGARRIDIPSVGHYWVLGEIEAGEVVEL